jgi:alpha-methylacyl-CoA racemase
MSSLFGMFGAGLHRPERGTNLLDSGAPHYEVYRCADGEYISIAPIENKFREELFGRLGLDEKEIPDLGDAAAWPKSKAKLAETFARKTRDEWCVLLEGTDVCFAPVLSGLEAAHHPHNRARGTFVEIDGVVQPAPGPRFGRTRPPLPRGARQCDGDTAELLVRWGIEEPRVTRLRSAGIMK